MKMIKTVFCMALVFSLSFSAQAALDSKAEARVSAEISILVTRIYRNLETLNYQDTINNIYSKDSLYATSDTYQLKGWEAINAAMIQSNAAIKSVKIDGIESDFLQILSPEHAIHTLIFYETVVEAGKTVYKKVVQTHVFKKQGTQWKVVHISAAHLYLDEPVIIPREERD